MIVVRNNSKDKLRTAQIQVKKEPFNMYAHLNQDALSPLKNGTRIQDFIKKFSAVVESNDL